MWHDARNKEKEDAGFQDSDKQKKACREKKQNHHRKNPPYLDMDITRSWKVEFKQQEVYSC